MRSMTGFGLGDASLAGARIVAEVRSVNQRFLDVRARLPRELADLTMFAEQVARERLRRGRVELAIHAEGALPSAYVLDKERARAAFVTLTELRDELVPGADVPLSILAAVPDLFTPTSGQRFDALRRAVRIAVERAIDAMDAMCHREGDTLAADMQQRVVTLRALTSDLVERAAAGRMALRGRLRERVSKLLEGTEASVDATRLEAEVVLLAERGDITEEVIRLSSHLDQFDNVLTQQGREPCGRRLDFLLQEMIREVNTLGAKAQDAGASQQVVAMKVELDRLREQVQNIE